MISPLRKIAANTLFIFFSRLIEFGSGIIIVVLVAKYLGVSKFGEFSFIRVAALFFAPLIVLGLPRIIIREISVDTKNTGRFLVAGLWLNIMMTIIVMALVSFIPVLYQNKSPVFISLLFVSVLTQAFLAASSTARSVFIALENSHFSSITTLVERTLVILLIFIAIRVDAGMAVIFWVILAADILGLAFTLYVLWKMIGIRIEKIFISHDLSFLLRESYPIAITNFMMLGYWYISIFLLQYFKDNVHVSLFEVSQRIIAPISFMSTTILLAFVPSLSRLGRNKSAHEDLLRIYEKSLKYFIVFTTPCCWLATYYAQDIIVVLYGEEFSGAARSFQVLIWTLVPAFCSGLMSFILTSIGEQRLLVVSNAACLAVNIILNCFVIKEYGYVGASWVSIVSFLVLFAVNFYYIGKHIGKVSLYRYSLLPLIFSLISYVLLHYIEIRVNFIVFSGCYLFVYLTTLYLLKTFTIEEKDFCLRLSNKVFRRFSGRRGR